MALSSKKQTARQLLKRYGQLYCDELGIPLHRGTPSPLFRWLCAALLYSARISQAVATRAIIRLADEGWTTAAKMAESTWKQRVRALNESGYARYDESTARMLGDTTQLLLDKYNGDLRNLREQARRRPDRERELLKEAKGIGDVGADIFLREVQIVWEELVPFADSRALATAKQLHLGNNARELSRLVDKSEFANLVAALVRFSRERRTSTSAK